MRTSVRMVANTKWDKREAELRAAIEDSRSFSEALRTLGMRAAGGNIRTLRRWVEHFGISTEHFEPNWARRYPTARRAKPLEEVLVERSTYSRAHLKERLYREGLKIPRCELCGQGERWRGLLISLILDHINGVHDDNRLENLRIVCPNCAATFDTHCGRNKRRAPVERECATCSATFRATRDQR
jgi:hypothetical protein